MQRLKRLDEALLTFDRALAIDPNVVVHTDFGAEMMAHLLGIGCNAVEPQKKHSPGAGM